MAQQLSFGFENAMPGARLTVAAPSWLMAEALERNPVLDSEGKIGNTPVMVPIETEGPEDGIKRLAFNTQAVDWIHNRSRGRTLNGFYQLVRALSMSARQGEVLPDPHLSFGAFHKKSDRYWLSVTVAQPDCSAAEAEVSATARMREMAVALKANRKPLPPSEDYLSRMESKVNYGSGILIRMAATKVRTVGVMEVEDPRRWVLRSEGMENIEYLGIAAAGLIGFARAGEGLKSSPQSVTLSESTN